MFSVKIENHSALYPLLQAYMREREMKGVKLAHDTACFKHFEKFSAAENYTKDYLSKDHYLSWLATTAEFSDCKKNSYAGSVIRFARYLNAIGHESYVGQAPYYACNYVPYIYTKEEISKIFEAADHWRDKNMLPNSAAMAIPAILRLLYSTGMRVGEAVGINNMDVDFEKHVIHLMHTKNRCERYVALPKSMEDVLRTYIRYGDKMPLSAASHPSSPLFVNHEGKRIRSSTVTRRYHDLQEVIGFQVTERGFLPRLHDIRHTACVHAMKKLMDSGKDIYCCLPQLAVFMGHKDPLDTEHYLRLTKSAYPELMKMDATVTQPIISIITQLIHDIDNGNI